MFVSILNEDDVTFLEKLLGGDIQNVEEYIELSTQK